MRHCAMLVYQKGKPPMSTKDLQVYNFFLDLLNIDCGLSIRI